MFATALVTLLAAALPQDTGAVAVPAYESREFGVSIPRPFDDWVFEPGVERRTFTVIFHPRNASLRGQRWGFLQVTSFPGRVSLRQVADQRLGTTWRPGRGGFEVRQRDSTALAGFPAFRTVVRGAIGGVRLDVEEYVVARGRELVLLQFRYPLELRRDSLEAGYRRMTGGLDLRFPPPPPAPPVAFLAESVASTAQVPPAPWQARAYDAAVAYDTAPPRADFTVRLDLVNSGPVPADSLTFWLWPGLELDSARTGTSRATLATLGSVSQLRLPAAVPPEGAVALTVFYHLIADSSLGPLPPALAAVRPDGAFLATDWLPRVQPRLDAAGQLVPVARPRYVIRFDLPQAWSAVAPGRLTSVLLAGGRRRVSWATEGVDVTLPAFALGRYRVVTRRWQGVAVLLWVRPSRDGPDEKTLDSIAETERSGWLFYSRAFGELPTSEINLAWTDASRTIGVTGLTLLGADAARGGATPESVRALENGSRREILLRELARTWWGGSVAPAGPGSAWLAEALPAWAAVAARGALDGDTVRQRLVRDAEAASGAAGGSVRPLASVAVMDTDTEYLRSRGVAAIEAARRAAGEALFREAILALRLARHNDFLTLDDLLAALGDDARAVLRPFLF